MAYFYDSINLQSKVSDIKHITWKNNTTRLNQTNLNTLSQGIRTISEILCDTSNSKKGLIEQFDNVRQLVQGTSSPNYSTKSMYAQLNIINRSLYGYRSKEHYQIGDTEDNSDAVLKYFDIHSLHSSNDAVKDVSGVLGKLYWKYQNQDKPFIDDYEVFRSTFKGGSYINDITESTPFSTTVINDKPYGITDYYNKATTPFYLDWENGFILNDNIKIDKEGNITPTYKGSTASLGTETLPFTTAYIQTANAEQINTKNAYIVNLEPITYTTGLQKSNIGTDKKRHEWGYFNNLRVTNQGNNKQDVIILGEKTDGGIDLGTSPTLYSATNQIFGDADDVLYQEDGTSLKDKTTYAVINYTKKNFDKVDEDIENLETEIDATFDLLADKDVISKQPSVSLTVTQQSSEVGTTIDPEYTVTLDPGLYKYNSEGTATNNEATGVTISKVVLTYDGNTTTLTDFTSNKVTGKVLSTPIVIPSDYTKTFTAELYYTDGTAKVYNNIARQSSVKITANAKNNSKTFTSYRNTFYTTSKTNDSSEYQTSDKIRSLSKTSSKEFNIAVSEGTKQIVIAVPNSRSIKTITDANAGHMQDWYTSSAATKSTVKVQGADLTDTNACNYEVVIIKDSTINGLKANTFKITCY